MSQTDPDAISLISSMTGFAHAEGELAGIRWAWDLRSVNGRGLEVRFRLPAGFDMVESALRDQASRTLRRGNVTANLTIRREQAGKLAVDQAALAEVLAIATDLAARIPGAEPPRADQLLALPGVLRVGPPEAESDLALNNAVRAGFGLALDDLVASRQAEGGRLHVVLSGQLDEIAALRDQAVIDAAEQPALHQARLHASLQILLADATGVPADRIAQEVALLAGKSDVREELDRLGSHIAAARDLLADDAAIGRRFDFLVQEFVRETNTLCSKSASIPLTAAGLRLKATIEQLREQVQNVE